jgi:RNA polymerase sigma factor (sigma-70 family)
VSGVSSFNTRVESASVTHTAIPQGLRPGLPLRGPTPLLRLQSDERLVALTRRGHSGAFEALVSRYNARLLAFCRHMLGSREDAEDVLQEVFAAAYNAMLGDDREINVRPWLYRIARNRSLNHLRRAQAIGVDSMDIHFAEGGQSTGDKVFKREEFRLLVGDVQKLPETQRTALLLREIDDLSYEQISEAMETTVPAVKSLLVRARVSLAEASEARRMSCDEVRLELGAIAEGLAKISPPVRRHVKECHRCEDFRGHLRTNNRALAAVMPVGPLLLLKKLLFVHLGTTAAASHSAGAAGSAAAAGSASSAAISAGAGAVATKAAAGLAAAALVTAGAVEVQQVKHRPAPGPSVAHVAATPRPAPGPAPVIVKAQAQPMTTKADAPQQASDGETTAPATHPAPVATTAPVDAPVTQQDADTTVLPGTADAGSHPAATPPADAPAPTDQAPPPSDGATPPTDAGTSSSDPSDPSGTPPGDTGDAPPPPDSAPPPADDGSASPPPPPPD